MAKSGFPSCSISSDQSFMALQHNALVKGINSRFLLQISNLIVIIYHSIPSVINSLNLSMHCCLHPINFKFDLIAILFFAFVMDGGVVKYKRMRVLKYEIFSSKRQIFLFAHFCLFFSPIELLGNFLSVRNSKAGHQKFQQAKSPQ